MLTQEKKCSTKALIAVGFLIGLVSIMVVFPYLIFILLWLLFGAKVKLVEWAVQVFGLKECLQGRPELTKALENIENKSKIRKHKKSSFSKKRSEKKLDLGTTKSYNEINLNFEPAVKNSQKDKSIWDNYESVLDKFNK